LSASFPPTTSTPRPTRCSHGGWDLARRPDAVAEYRAEAAKLTGEASIASLFRHLSASRLVSIAQIEGRVRGAGGEFVLACDMRFAARETAIFGQIEPAFGLIPGGGATQYLVRVMGRARALEVLLSADDYDAELAERYGWINRALPADMLEDFVMRLAHRIAAFPGVGHVAVKDRVNAISLAPAEDFRRDSDLFGDGARHVETQGLIQAAFKRGLQTPDGSWPSPRSLPTWVIADPVRPACDPGRETSRFRDPPASRGIPGCRLPRSSTPLTSQGVLVARLVA
jgi:enoyl-CoA hydratase/carnithine racemase